MEGLGIRIGGIMSLQVGRQCWALSLRNLIVVETEAETAARMHVASKSTRC